MLPKRAPSQTPALYFNNNATERRKETRCPKERSRLELSAANPRWQVLHRGGGRGNYNFPVPSETRHAPQLR
ncbi:hypothetical protein E2C01_081762 [Portunus trituberculatus]|uniref:Uncharacterized protein n=1 Tax=Portunus trituberculatus TaxID=210409 RepID=A0A5B7IXH5_PORTR|nr:hypothetical protein [Portunus trituberculatus]